MREPCKGSPTQIRLGRAYINPPLLSLFIPFILQALFHDDDVFDLFFMQKQELAQRYISTTGYLLEYTTSSFLGRTALLVQSISYQNVSRSLWLAYPLRCRGY